ncbi:MAG: PAS domain-containing sensor histidine kinase, partial [Hyphomicrobiales bacterium]|nr:PAS domain-containing sensor histidine kinase [Hyphomicrobiales bacterium]
LLNLLSNAIKFTDPGGNITIGARREGDNVAFYVTDTGIGIAEADIPKLGTPFVQADSAYDRKYEGTGLGLSVVRGLVELHDGDIRITSKLGRGTTITVRLPVSGPAPRPATEEEAAVEEKDTAPVELAAARKERQLNSA